MPGSYDYARPFRFPSDGRNNIMLIDIMRTLKINDPSISNSWREAQMPLYDIGAHSAE